METTINHYKFSEIHKVKGSFLIIALLIFICFSMAACEGPEEPDSKIVTPELTGTVSITGTAQVGQILTANNSSLGGSGTITYQWKRGSAIIGTNSSTYTVQTDDVGSTITVTVTREGYSGSVTSSPLTISTLQFVSEGRIEYYWVNQHGSLVTTSGSKTTVCIGEPLTITAHGTGYVVREWYLNGLNTGQSGTMYNFSSTTTGDHSVGLLVEKGGKLYNTNITITVAPMIITTNANEWNAALAFIRNGGNGTSDTLKNYAIKINGNITVPGSSSTDISLGSVQYVEVTLIGSGRLFLDSNGSILNIGSNQKLIIDSEDLILQGHSSNNRSVIFVDYNGTLELKNGTISGYTSSQRGVYSDGTFTMNGGTITGFTGSGVYSSGSFTMNGGSISGNTSASDSNYSYSDSYSYGGGVYISDGSFTMNGGTISGNTSSSSSSYFSYSTYSYGGGVYISDGSFTMNGGTISGNTSDSFSYYSDSYSYGGGVYISDGSFTMNGGTISGNTSRSESFRSISYSYGGGVYISEGSFTMNGGTISGNTYYSDHSYSSYFSYSYGGGVYSSGTFTMSGGIISGNTSSLSSYSNGYGCGGGVYVYGSSSVFVKSGGGVIYGNNEGANSNIAKDGGPAVYYYRSPSNQFWRNTTLGENDNISTDVTTSPPWNQWPENQW